MKQPKLPFGTQPRDRVDRVWQDSTRERIAQVKRVIGLKQLVEDQPEVIRRNLRTAIRYFEEDARANWKQRIHYGWRGDMYDEREMTGRIVRGIAGFVMENHEITERDRITTKKDYRSDAEDMLWEFMRLLGVQFPQESVPEPRSYHPSGQMRPHGNIIARARCR